MPKNLLSGHRRALFYYLAFGALAALLIAAAFGRSLHNEFTLDDRKTLLYNPAVTDGDVSVVRIFLDGATHTSSERALMYRPLRTLLFRFEYSVFGPRPVFWHAVNLVLHLCVVLLGALFAGRLLGRPAAAAVALLFAVHPLNAEIVLSVKAQDDLMASCFLLGALLMLPGFQRGDYSNREWPLFQRVVLVILYGLALLAKESAASLPVLIAAWFLLHPPAASGRRISRAMMTTVGAMFAILALFLALRHYALQAAHPGKAPPSVYPLAFTSLAQVPRYLALAVLPSSLTVDYTHIRVLSPLSWQLWLSLSLQCASCVLLWRLRSNVVRWGIIWFYVLLLPSLNVFGGIVPFAERFAYMPLWGLLFIGSGLAVEIVRLLPKSDKSLRVAPVIIGMLVSGLALRSFYRSTDWQNNEKLFRSALEVNPSARIMKTFLAEELLAQGRTAEAREYMAESKPLNEDLSGAAYAVQSFTQKRALHQQAMAFMQEKKYDRADPLLRRITSSTFATAADWINYGTVLTNLGKLAEARLAFAEVVRLSPKDGAPFRMLGRIAIEEGNLREAIRLFDQSTVLDPGNALGWYFGARLRIQLGEWEQAAARLEKARAFNVKISKLVEQEPDYWTSAPDTVRLYLNDQAQSAGSK